MKEIPKFNKGGIIPQKDWCQMTRERINRYSCTVYTCSHEECKKEAN